MYIENIQIQELLQHFSHAVTILCHLYLTTSLAPSVLSLPHYASYVTESYWERLAYNNYRVIPLRPSTECHAQSACESTMNNCHVSCEVFITAPQLWESLVVFYRITRGKVTQQIISLSTHGPQHIYACGKFMFTLQTLDKQRFLAELVRATQTHCWIRQVTFQKWSCWHDHMIFCSSTSAFVNFLSVPMCPHM